MCLLQQCGEDPTTHAGRAVRVHESRCPPPRISLPFALLAAPQIFLTCAYRYIARGRPYQNVKGGVHAHTMPAPRKPKFLRLKTLQQRWISCRSYASKGISWPANHVHSTVVSAHHDLFSYTQPRSQYAQTSGKKTRIIHREGACSS